MDSIHAILRDKGGSIHATNPDTTVRSAVEAMCSAHIGALLVMRGEAMAGIFSERDLMTRVVLAGRDPATTRVGDVMTREVICVKRSLSVAEAMALLTRHRVRHLPVKDGARVVGIVSIGDLVQWQIRDLDQEVDHLRSYFAGYPV